MPSPQSQPDSDRAGEPPVVHVVDEVQELMRSPLGVTSAEGETSASALAAQLRRDPFRRHSWNRRRQERQQALQARRLAMLMPQDVAELRMLRSQALAAGIILDPEHESE